MFRRISAACALFAVVALGFAAPAETSVRPDGSAASASSLDTALVVASARRVRGTGSEIDGRPAGHRHAPLDLFRPPWLTAAATLPPPPAIDCGKTVLAPLRAPTAFVLASRTSRGPPSRS